MRIFLNYKSESTPANLGVDWLTPRETLYSPPKDTSDECPVLLHFEHQNEPLQHYQKRLEALSPSGQHWLTWIDVFFRDNPVKYFMLLRGVPPTQKHVV